MVSDRRPRPQPGPTGKPGTGRRPRPYPYRAPPAGAGASGTDGLRARALRGGRYLAVREGLGIVFRSAGLLLLTRIIGPTSYGLFAGPSLLVVFLAAVATTGTDVFLIRRAGELVEDWYHQVFSYLLVSSVAVAAITVAAAGAVGGLLPEHRFVAPLQVLACSIPLNILWIPGRAKLERAFDYRRLAWVEVGGDVCQYLVSVGLALAGAGVWAAVWGFLARQAWMLVSVSVLSGYRPRWRWDRTRLRELLGFGWVQSSTAVANRAGDLVVPLVVGGFLGARGVGIAALTLRLADTLSFVNRATYRLSIVTMGKLQQDLPRLKRAVDSAMALQVLGVGPLLVAFSLTGTVAVPLFLGERWAAVMSLFPYVALNYLLMALFTMQTAALVVTGRNRSVLVTNLVALVLLYAGGLLLVPTLGLPGYGLTETLALAAQWVSHRAMRRAVPGGLDYRPALPLLAVLIPPLFFPAVPWPWRLVLLLPPALVLAHPRSRAQLRAQLAQLVRAGTGRGARAEASAT